jgi:hypothetical protein
LSNERGYENVYEKLGWIEKGKALELDAKTDSDYDFYVVLDLKDSFKATLDFVI